MTAKLKIRKYGKKLLELHLDPSKEYIAGRNQDADISLDAIKGISRQHFRLVYTGEHWTVELISKVGSLYHENEAVDSLELSMDCCFSVPPYEFFFYREDCDQPEPANSSEIEPAEKSLMKTPHHHEHPLTQSHGNIETTHAGISSLQAFLKVSIPDNNIEEVLHLEGNIWVGGREPACEIFLDHHHVSRRHFELTQTNEGIFITDLGSANGTEVNGQLIPANEPFQIFSGDVIHIMTVRLVFEVRDLSFEKKLQNLPAPVTAPSSLQWTHQHLAVQPPWDGFTPDFYTHNGPAVMRLPTEDEFDFKNPKTYKYMSRKHKLRLGAGVAIAFVLFLSLQDNSDRSKEEGSRNESSSAMTFDNLRPEQKTAIRDTFNLAGSLYAQGRYELCSAELRKIHEIIPYYENSKELEAFCAQGSELVRKQKDLDRVQREREQIERQITIVVQDCRQKVNAHTTVSEMQSCLGPAIELDPEHNQILEILMTVQDKADERKRQEEAASRRQAQVQAGQRQYQRAKSLADQGQLAQAIQEYSRFLSGNYPGMNETRSNAQREIAAIKEKLSVKLETLITSCRNLKEEKKYKDAYKKCQEAVSEDPNHKDAPGLQAEILSALRREMRDLYEESILEESLGNVDSAKEKWKLIMEKDLKDQEYYSRAREKLRLYGIGL